MQRNEIVFKMWGKNGVDLFRKLGLQSANEAFFDLTLNSDK